MSTHEQAKKVNRNIFETIYNAALEKSCEIARDRKEAMQFLSRMRKFWGAENDVSREYHKVGHPEKNIQEKEVLIPQDFPDATYSKYYRF